MRPPISRLSKKEIIWLNRNKCKHQHTYLSHYPCYLKENPNQERIGFFDIETSHLKANFGIIFSYCIKVKDGKIYHRRITKKELKDCLDREVVRQCIKDLEKFDRIITYYGSKFDFPFLRSRALKHKIEFPVFGEIIHDDIWFVVRGKFKLHSNRQDVACKFLLGHTEKTHLDPDIWMSALQGNEKSISWIVDHNKRDVKDLEKLYNTVIPYARHKNSSI